VHSDVEVSDGDLGPGQCPIVSQAYCSALPVAYTHVPVPLWQPFAKLVLEAAYEATLCAAVLNARRGRSNVVLLTRLGGGVFGNDDDWIAAAMCRALAQAAGTGLDVRLVSYGAPPVSMVEMAQACR
jgi:O-acetyl-ADP-ribose deacetylase (regulator of RNase III)